MTKKRKHIPENVRIQVWTEAGGRCQFKGCNKPLWYNGLTLSDGNFSELAHIIGASEEGPRGNKDSEKLQDKAENIMLLCQSCHKEIDDTENIKKFPVKLLRKWKKEHDERIKIQTSVHDEIYKTTILKFQYNIEDRQTFIADEQIYGAISPKYPSDRKGIVLSKDNFDRSQGYDYWMQQASEIERDIKRKFELGIDGDEIKHVSVFAIGAMPLLMYLGKCVTDTIPIDIYQSHRNIEDVNKTWCWQNHETRSTYILNEKSIVKKGKDIAIVLALSDTIEKDKYEKVITEDYAIYELTIDKPSPLFLKNRKQLEAFSYEFRKLLNHVQKEHGFDCRIHLFPAVPVSIAVQIGRLLLPTKEPEIFVYEFYPKSGFRKVLRLN